MRFRPVVAAFWPDGSSEVTVELAQGDDETKQDLSKNGTVTWANTRNWAQRR